jgi:hypothetical protein
MLTLAYGILAVAVLGTLLRLWKCPVQVVALVLAMHGIDQVLIAKIPAVAARPYLINLAVGTLALAALVIAILRRPPPTTSAGLIWLRSLVIGFFCVYALGVFTSRHAENSEYARLLWAMIPYIVLQLILLPPIVARSSARELLHAFGTTGVICVCIMMIVALDTTLHTAGTSFGNRVLLQMQGEQGALVSNSLALADVGVLALVMILLVGLRSEWLMRWAPGVLSPSVAGWMVLGISVPYLVWVMRISRTEPLAGVLALVTTWLMQPRRNRFKPFVVAGLVMLLLCLLGSQLFESLLQAVPQLRLLDDGFRVRMEFVQHSLDAYLDGGITTLLFGLGPGYSYVTIGTYPHHHLTETLTELGLCGLAMYVAIVWLIACGVRTLMRQAGPALRGVVEVVSAMFVYSLVLSMKRGSVLAPDIFMWSFFVADFLGRFSRVETTVIPQFASQHRPARIPYLFPRPA